MLETTVNDVNVMRNERAAAAELLEAVLDDRFLFVLHFHFDLHECVSGKINLPYYFSRYSKICQPFFYRRTHENDAKG